MLLLIALAFARGVYGLGSQSLWWDESLSLQRANYNLLTVLSNKIILTDTARQVVTLDNHPPLYFLLLHFVVKLAGQSEFVLRFPSLAFSVLTVPLLYAVGKYLFNDRRVGLLAALFGAISPLYLWYSHEARMYTMLTFWGLLSFYALLKILTPTSNSCTEPSRSIQPPTSNLQLAIIYIASSVAMLATHYLSFLILLVELVVFLSFIRNARRRPEVASLTAEGRRRVAIPVLGVLLIALPILYYGFSILPKGEMAGFRFIPLSELLRDVSNSFSLGISVKTERVLAVHWVFRGVFLIGALAIVWRAFRRPPSSNFQLPTSNLHPPTSNKALSALIYLSVPVLAIYLLSYVRPAYMNVRHLIMVSPAFYLIVAAGLAAIKKKWPLIFASCLALMIAGSAHSTQQYFSNEKYAKDDHRAWGEYLKAHTQPGDVIVVDPPHISQLYQYYAGVELSRAGLPWTGLPRLTSPDQDTVSALEELGAEYDRIWLAFSGTPKWGDPERLPKKWLEENAFLVDERSFHNYASVVKLSCFLTNSPVLKALPEVQHPMEANFEDQLLFLGYDLQSRPAAGGQFVHLNLYWKALPSSPQKLEGIEGGQASPPGSGGIEGGPASPPGLGGIEGGLEEDYRVSLRLLDGENRLWGWAVRAPLNGRYPTSQWLPGQIIKDDYEFLVDVGTPPGLYRLEMVVHDNGRQLAVVNEDSNPRGRAVDMGLLQVGKPVSWPAVSGATASLPLEHHKVMDFGDIQLLGYDFTEGNFWPGGSVWARPYWRATRKPVEDYSFYFRLVDEHKQLWAEEVIQPAGDGYPTSFWDEGEIVKGQHALRIPREAPGGDYYVGIVLRQPESYRATADDVYALDMGKIHVIQIEREFDVPAIQYPHQANLGGLVEFLGYDLEWTGFTSGEVVPLTLYWRALEQMDTSYTVFTHLIDEDKRIWGQQDNPPQEGRHPTTLWIKGEVVTDKYSITIDPDTPSGQYALEIGLYDAATEGRLPVLNEKGENVDDRVLLPKVWVIAETEQ